MGELDLRLGSSFGFVSHKPPSPDISDSTFSDLFQRDHHQQQITHYQKPKEIIDKNDDVGSQLFYPPRSPPLSPVLQLDLLPRTPAVASRPSFETDEKAAAAVFTAAEEGGGESPRRNRPIVWSSLYSGGTAASGGGDGGGGLTELEEGENDNSGEDQEDQNNLGSRKKLRLSREQSAFLEESFKEHHSLYPKQKLELARRLNLRPRQVEVWFQNRRARTKLKQNEVECEYLKKWCETLTQQNRKLHKELQDLRALKTTDSLSMRSPATTLTLCASCERDASCGGANAGKVPVNSGASRFSFSRTDPSSQNY